MEEFLENPPFPKFLQFETATTCNAHCLMCPHSKMKRRGNSASWTTIGKIIQEAVPKVDAVCPFLMQEPLIEPRLLPILSNIKARNPNAKTILYTNMAGLTREQTTKIIDYNLLDELHISFYGPTEELYKKWQPPLDWHKTRNNIIEFHGYREQMGKQLPVIQLHVLAVPEIVQAWKGYEDLTPHVDSMALVQYDTFHGDVPNYGGDQTRFMGRAPTPRTPCQRLWNGLNVHFDGNVVPCCIDYDDMMVIGNIHQNTLEEIWMNDKFQRIRSLHMQGKWKELPLCQNCVVHEYQFSEEWVRYWLLKELTVNA